MRTERYEPGEWAEAYDTAVGKGRAVAVMGELGPWGSLGVIVEAVEDGETVYYLPYLNQAPFDAHSCQGYRPDSCQGCTAEDECLGKDDCKLCICGGCQFELDPVACLEDMESATR